MSPVFTAENPLRIAVLISGSGTTLANLIERIRDGRLQRIRIVLVVSSRTSVRGIEIARAAGLPTRVLTLRECESGAEHSQRLTRLLDEANVDVVVMAGFLCHWALPERYQGRVLNIHPALLPAFGGKGMYGDRVHAAVLESGQRETGCTVHLVNDEYDRGPIVAASRLAFDPGRETVASLGERVRGLERELYPQVLQNVADRGISWLTEVARPQ